MLSSAASPMTSYSVAYASEPVSSPLRGQADGREPPDFVRRLRDDIGRDCDSEINRINDH